ncbi:TetR/AcrR family transcriptional regulator [Paenibacillus crassostreae]|uniref:TetR family transcriptional regulator n=1 Tax=Paenibacillus crassostreae TaxID=1763538 RepID=A0A167FDM2_9BACL|nr:TetR/AcrR family transcriptional regulator [Paenibacillus crassostreae]AOZ90790.1 TetR family transcriptional regulator [Paenibacillus crassostreae]OAB76444.1 TetR family transcriptional regulator [Paenibacillus crassostreae]
MTSQKIMSVALRHFARNGYEGASLADIATEVGIKKPSIYNHFKGKDDLFMAVYQDVAKRELHFVEAYLKPDRHVQLEQQLFGFLSGYKERYEKEEDTKFFLRMSFFPPVHLQQQSLKMSLFYIDQMADQAKVLFQSAKQEGLIHADVTIEQATGAYMAVLDSLVVEMLYGDHDHLMKRLEVTWHVFWRGVRNI